MNSDYYKNPRNEKSGGSQPQKPLSYSQQKRAQMDYRSEYFKHNPGLFGCIWKCAYCGRPLFGRHAVQVDHIVPLNNPLGVNKGINLVAACPKCNQAKSDKFDYRCAVGYASKISDSVIFGLQKIFIIALAACWTGLQYACSFLAKVLVLPFKKTSLVTKLVFGVIYAIILILICKQLFGGA